MHRDLIREAEIDEDLSPELRGEMACVADPDACGDGGHALVGEEDESIPDTVPETQPSAPGRDDMTGERPETEGMSVWAPPIST